MFQYEPLVLAMDFSMAQDHPMSVFPGIFRGPFTAVTCRSARTFQRWLGPRLRGAAAPLVRQELGRAQAAGL